MVCFAYTPSLRYPRPASSANLQRSESTIASDAQRILDEASAEVKAAHPGIQVESMLGEGDPRDVLCNRASEDFVDFIIVGSQGKTALTKAMTGSVSQYLLRHAPCPVLVHPPSAGTSRAKKSTSLIVSASTYREPAPRSKSAGAVVVAQNKPNEPVSRPAAAAVVSAAAGATARGKGAMEVGGGGQAQVCAQYSLAEVVQATNEWVESRRIGGGSFGDVYKGECPHNPSLAWAVKRAKVLTNDFKREVSEMATKNHPNLVRLVGYCLDFSPVTERMEQIVIYEFMPNGDLEHWIGPSAKQTLTMRQRLDILIGTARGLEYLHEFGVVHRDIKPANILLDDKMKAKVADFGLVRHGEGTSVAATRVMGTPGYVDPAYYKSQKATPMADVHSFGVVMLTVLTARNAICNLDSDQVNLKAWVAPFVACNNVAAFKDPDLEASDDIILRLARLALSCTAMPTASRPSMSRVLAELMVIKEDCLGLEANRMAERIDKELDTSITQDFDGELARIANIKSGSCG
ncbi:unnamed protein product [Closterium sp. Yama58-4]|nr:unnamed protein product [Closterium sp. Yama58-4]